MNDQDLSHFITNANLNKEPQNVDVIYSFCNDMKLIPTLQAIENQREIISLKI